MNAKAAKNKKAKAAFRMGRTAFRKKEGFYNEFKEEFKNLDESFFDEDINVNALEVINIDYINGLIKLKDKYTGKIFTKKTKYLNDNLKYSKENFSLENTFSYQIYNNKIYK